jgi:hypothetical protein
MNKMLALFSFTALLVLGCGKIDNAIDCHQVCDRYRDCYDAKYDVDACADRCRDASSKDSDYQSKADQCEACIGSKSCAAATFQCATSCGSIVP